MYKLDWLWPYEDGSVAEAAYEVANGRTFAYRKLWAGIFLQRAAEQCVQRICRWARQKLASRKAANR